MMSTAISNYIFLAIFWLIVFWVAYKGFKAIRGQHRIAFAIYSILVLILLWVGFIIGVTPGSRAYADYTMTRDLFGAGFILPHPTLEYNSDRAFNGDGYTIEVYNLNDNEVNKITSTLSHSKNSLPTRPSVRSHWKQTYWQQTPIKKEEQQFLEFALLENVSDRDLEEAHKLLNALAHEPGHYYSYFYFMHDKDPGDIDFFLFSPRKHLLIFVNNNT